MQSFARSTLTILLALPLAALGAPPLGAQPHADDVVTLIAAGDIAGEGPGAAETAKLVAKIPGQVALLGDDAYNKGSVEDFQRYYDPTWGPFRARTHPAPGNHEYLTPGAAGYFGYFGAAAGKAGEGWYSYDLGKYWHAIALNSNYRNGVAVDAKSPQYAWLKHDLETHAGRHLIAYCHHPRFSSGPHGDNVGMDDIWKLLYAHHVDIMLCGHDHDYERFRALNADGDRDDANGIHLFIVGTGGKSHSMIMRPPHLHTVIRNASAYGVLELQLKPDAYSWKFLPVAGESFHDAGDARTHWAVTRVPAAGQPALTH